MLFRSSRITRQEVGWMSNLPRRVPDQHSERVEIDHGFRSWYESCPCCLSEAYPDVKQALDDEQVIRATEEAAEH